MTLPTFLAPRRLFATLALVAAGLATTPVDAAQCFSMFDTANRLLYQGTETPIDLSQPISQEMRAFFPNRYLVISFATTCPEAGTLSDRTVSLDDASLQPREATATSRARRRR